MSISVWWLHSGKFMPRGTKKERTNCAHVRFTIPPSTHRDFDPPRPHVVCCCCRHCCRRLLSLRALDRRLAARAIFVRAVRIPRTVCGSDFPALCGRLRVLRPAGSLLGLRRRRLWATACVHWLWRVLRRFVLAGSYVYTSLHAAVCVRCVVCACE